MRYINPTNLPQPFVEAIKNDGHVSLGSNLGASGVSMPPRIIALLARHDDEIVVDVRNRMFSLWGQAVHVVLERAAKADGVHVFAEQRAEILVRGWRIAARLDHLEYNDARKLTDYKVTSVWSVKEREPKPEWVAQCNVTHLVTVEGLGLEPFRALQVTAMLRDYRKNEKLRYGDDYPDADIVNVPIPLWPLEKTRAYLDARVALHQAAQSAAVLPECTAEERWEQPTVFAVTKKGRKTAVRLYESRELAETHADTQPDLTVITRPGKSNRCAQYCDVLPFCEQGKAIVAAQATEKEG